MISSEWQWRKEKKIFLNDYILITYVTNWLNEQHLLSPSKKKKVVKIHKYTNLNQV